MELQEFLRSHNDWEKLLKHDPYNLQIKHQCDHFIIFNYNQYNSDLSLAEVKQARGIIFDETNNYEIACYPFDKFFNASEPLSSKIDWTSACVQTKVDGSIMKLFWNKYTNTSNANYTRW